tara:strand:+ start:398 stop:556 length:159 start_codon:yes stop_codon:yes gene_type:complete
MSYNGKDSYFWCQECKTDEVVLGCPFCLKYKIKDLQAELKFYKQELELIKEG